MLNFTRTFCPPHTHPIDTVDWTESDVTITKADGSAAFHQPGVCHPTTWSATAVKVVASKYFAGHLGASNREDSIYNPIDRATETISRWLLADGYTDSHGADAARADLAWLCLHQHFAFNTPVWLNVGVTERPQTSACFINSVEDNLQSIMDLAKTEALEFSNGSGAGSNLSNLRANGEPITGGGESSGPVSFQKALDSFGGVIKSGGKKRRSAKMAILDVDHPDILEFIACKATAEEAAHDLIDAGWPAGFDEVDGAYAMVPFQSANHSVRVPDAFMAAVNSDGDWTTTYRTTGKPAATVKARSILTAIAEAAWTCGDPGMQFDDTINGWHTCPNTDRIHASNPCSEYMFLNDSACNLGSLNLLKFLRDDNTFDVDRFTAAIRLAITAMDALIDRSSYPTERIAENSRNFRPLGLGYANLGALLMSMGLPYDSDEARHLAAAITSLLSATAYHQSALLAEQRGPFAGFAANRESMLAVVFRHRIENQKLCMSVHYASEAGRITNLAMDVWDRAYDAGNGYGYRNAQVTVLAPTGTIGFMMDCDTTGIEPDFALIKYKALVGGGSIRTVNRSVPRALQSLGYAPNTTARILRHLEATGDITTAPDLHSFHRPVFACANDIAPSGHLRMMAAAQTFLSGAISKTVNVPHSATPADIYEIYREAHRLGLKAVAVYRDGCKRSQPLTTTAPTSTAPTTSTPTTSTPTPAQSTPTRRRLPTDRAARTHKFSIGGHEGYITVGFFEDGTPGEVFVQVSKEGSTLSGLLDAWAIAVSIALQHGVPIDTLTAKFSGARYEPSGFTGNPAIPYAASITDYVARFLASATPLGAALHSPTPTQSPAPTTSGDGPPCGNCGTLTVRAGTCYVCAGCGTTTGCG